MKRLCPNFYDFISKAKTPPLIVTHLFKLINLTYGYCSQVPASIRCTANMEIGSSFRQVENKTQKNGVSSATSFSR